MVSEKRHPFLFCDGFLFMKKRREDFEEPVRFIGVVKCYFPRDRRREGTKDQNLAILWYEWWDAFMRYKCAFTFHKEKDALSLGHPVDCLFLLCRLDIDDHDVFFGNQ